MDGKQQHHYQQVKIALKANKQIDFFVDNSFEEIPQSFSELLTLRISIGFQESLIRLGYN